MEVAWDVDTSRLGILRRGVATLWLARSIHKKVRALEKDLEEEPEPDEDLVQERWDELHRANAKLTYQHIIKYKGFLAKVGQAVSAIGGSIPLPWRDEFRPLQDHLPVSSADEVRRTIRDSLGRRLDDVFVDFQEKPLASATVGQAHCAHLRTTGQKVCVKVLHAGVGKIMQVDLGTIEYIAKKAIKSHKDAPDITPLIREWRRASREEVDFRLEAANAKRASDCLQKHGVDVKCPAPIEGLCSDQVLTMEFIEGWKVTDIEKLPAGTDVEALAKKILLGFNLLVFQEGLVHGDPHPGNVFVEPVGESGVRPVFLDWGIVRSMTTEERQNVARWAIASLSRDRVLFRVALENLGYVFTEEFETGHLDAWIRGSAFLFRDSMPRSTADYFFDQVGKMHEERETEKKKTEDAKKAEMDDASKKKRKKRSMCSCCGKKKKKDNKSKSPVDTIPGSILFFTRALNMLQGVCASLNVSISFAEPVLSQALPLLSQSLTVPDALPAPTGSSDLEVALRTKLHELELEGRVMGAQIAVMRSDGSISDQWLCSLAYGRAGTTNGPVKEDTLMPLLDVGVGVLVLLLLDSLARPSASGRDVSLDTPVSELWPEFNQHGRKAITIIQFLHHLAKLDRPFQSKKITAKRFCDEKAMEDGLVSVPQTEQKGGVCPMIGALAAGILRRITGHECAAKAVQAALKPIGLHEEIAYSGSDSRMAFVSRRPMRGLSLERMFDRIEEERQKIEAGEGAKPPWLSWEELGDMLPACTDPLLSNRPELRKGEACSTGRGLRATATALCRLYATKIVAPKNLERRHRLAVQSLEEWESASRCVDAGAGLQLFRFRPVPCTGTEEPCEDIFGYGHADGATGSFALRVRNINIVVLLNGVRALDETPRHVGHELVSVISEHFGLEPQWQTDVPKVPAKTPRTYQQGAKTGGEEDLREIILRLEAKVAEVAEKCNNFSANGCELPHDISPTFDRGGEFVGSWASIEVVGIDSILEAFQVPSAFHFVAKQAKRTLRVDLHNMRFTIVSAASVAGQSMEETTDFVVGTSFRGRHQLGGDFEGAARWDEPQPGEQGEEALVIEKRFTIDGKEVALEETFRVDDQGHLRVTTACRGHGREGSAQMIFERQGEPPQHVKRRNIAPAGGPPQREPTLNLVETSYASVQHSSPWACFSGMARQSDVVCQIRTPCGAVAVIR